MEKEQIGVAVTGMACRFPGANNLNEFWRNLVEGRDTIKHFTDEELSGYEYNYNVLKDNPDYVRARGVLSDIDKFDAEFFGMTPNEAAGTDPQHRIWLETVWEALENAGCDPFSFKGPIGVFAGGYLNTYLLNNILRDKVKLENYIRLRTTESFQILTGNDVAFLPTKTAYKFNLRGPAVNVQTACSTSLVAISLACQSLISLESDICIAGGVCIVVPQESGYLHQEGAIPSPDGKCRPFDENGRGTVFSNGIGVVILKRLEDALRDRDRIYAVVRGWALNNDGNNKVSYMAPSVEGQAEAILMAQALADIRPEQIGYIEAHGTATQLGDPIELTALGKAFSSPATKLQSIGIGSVKSNIGHTDAAAGVASFIKSCLSVYNKIIPPSLNFNKPNPFFDFINSPFYVQEKLKNWKGKEPLIIGVSSFGIGGTNAHVIIEEPPASERTHEPDHEWPQLLLLSARSEEAVCARMKDLSEHLEEHPELRMADVAYTLHAGRNHMPFRTFCTAMDIKDGFSTESFIHPVKATDNDLRTTFMFSGQGSQYVGMGHELYNANPRFRKILDECFDIFRNEKGYDLKEILFGEMTSELAEKKLARTDITQPALFIVEYALARLYEDHGVRPDYLIGHSIGEFTAACLSGVFDMESALKIVIERGSLMQQMPSGKMLAVRCSVDQLKELGDFGFEIAAENSDNQCTISFSISAADTVQSLLNKKGIQYQHLNTSHAFHSSTFDPILEKFSHFVESFDLKPPSIPFISCLTGDFITPDQAISGEYWAKQLRNTVQFKKGVSALARMEDVLFLEIGPNTHLTGLTRQNPGVINKGRAIPSLGKNDLVNEKIRIISSLGYMWANGLKIDFSGVFSFDDCRKVTLPSYPFQKKRYWIDHFQSETVVNNSLKETTALAVDGKEKETITALKELLCQTSGYSQGSITENASFEKMGFDSLFLTQYAQNIHRKFGVKVEFRQLVSEYPTLTDLSRLVDGRKLPLNIDGYFINRKNHKLNNFVKFQPEGTKDPLIILHGQNADSFIPEYLGKDHPYYGFIHPGSDGEEISFKSVSEMAGAYLDQLLKHKPKGPYYLGGFSFGGVLAFEMAKQLEKLGQAVPFVILFDTYAAKEPFRWHKNLYRIVRSDIAGPLVRSISRLIKLGICESCLMLKKPTPVGLRSFYIVDKYFSLADTFKPEKFNGRLILFRAVENKSSLEYLGWKKYVDDLQVIPLKAGHVTILKSEECIRTIQTEIKKLLDSENNDPKNDQGKSYYKIEQHV